MTTRISILCLAALAVVATTAQAAVVVTTSKAVYLSNESIIVNVTGLPGNAQDWVSIATSGSSASSWASYQYTQGKTSGTWTFTPVKAGAYEARVYFNSQYVIQASVNFQVNDAPCTYTFNPATATAPAEGVTSASASLTTSASTCSWTASSSATWLHLTPSTGSGSTFFSLRYTVDANPSTTPRTGIVTVGSQTFTVTQDGQFGGTVKTSKDVYTAAEPIVISASGLPGNKNDYVAVSTAGAAPTSYIEYAYTNGQVNGSWTLNPVRAGNYEARVYFNNTYVVQAKYNFQVTDAPCTYTFNPTSAAAPAEGVASGSVSLTTSASTCSWTAASSAAWLHLTTTTGSGSTFFSVRYTVDPNPTTTARSGVITVGGGSFTVIQAGQFAGTINTSKDTYSADESIVISATGLPGNKTDYVAVSTIGSSAGSYVEYAYTNGQTDGTWTLNPVPVGNYEACLYFSNGSTIQAKVPFTVVAACTYTLDSTSLKLPIAGGAGTINVTASAATCAWTATTKSAWIRIAAGAATGNGSVNFTVDPNPGTAGRTDVIAIGSKTFRIVQDGSAPAPGVQSFSTQSLAGAGATGDGGPASSATLAYPSAITFDTAGNLYIADSYNAVIRKVTTDGTIRTIAGNGTFGNSGDGGPALNAQLGPQINGIAVDTNGNVFISDLYALSLRKITPDGAINTVPGSMIGALAADTAGNIFVADLAHAQVRKLTPDGNITAIAGTGQRGNDGDEGPAANATFAKPSSIFVDAGGILYVADASSGRIRTITPDGLIHAYAGGGGEEPIHTVEGISASDAAFAPAAIRKDKAGNLLVLETDFNRIRQISPDGKVTTLAGSNWFEDRSDGDGGPAIKAQFNFPFDIAVSPAGDVYVADSNSEIRVIGADGMIRPFTSLRFAGDGGPAAQAVFAQPAGVAVDPAGNVYIADQDNYRVRKIDTAGNISTIAGNGQFGYAGDGGPATAAKLTQVYAVAADASGNVYVGVADRVRRISPDGTINTFAGGGDTLADGPATKNRLFQPSGITLDAAGNVIISDTLNGRVVKVTPDGNLTTLAGNTLYADTGDGGPAIKASLSVPYGLAYDRAGDLYITDSGHCRVRMVKPDGTIMAFAGNGKCGDDGDGGPANEATLYNPRSVVVDNAGNVYIADEGVARIKMVTPDGMIHTIATAKELDALPNFNPAVDVDYPWQYDILFLALDPAGKLYVADQYRERIRVMTPQ